MPFLCCGNNSAVVEDTSKPPVVEQPEAPPTPVTSKVATSDSLPISSNNTAATSVESPTPADTTTKTKDVVTTPVEQPETPKVVEKDASPPAPKPMEALVPAAEPAVVVTTAPPTAAATVANDNDESKPPSSFLTSIVGPTVILNGQVESTEVAFQGCALVAILYAAPGGHSDDVTKKLEVFCAGYERKSLDVVYCAADENDVYATSDSMPSSWYSVPLSSAASVAINGKRALSIKAPKSATTATPTLVVINPDTAKVVSKSTSPSTLDSIVALDPFADDYDKKSSQLFQDWIKELPMEQDVVGEIEMLVDEPEVDDDEDDDDDDDDSEED